MSTSGLHLSSGLYPWYDELMAVPPNSEETIRRIVGSVFHAFAQHDAEGTDAYFSEDGTVWDAFTKQLFRGREERKLFHAQDQAQAQSRGPLALSLEWQALDVYDDVALARYVVVFNYAPPNAKSGRIRATTVLRYLPTISWQIVHHHEGAEPEP